MWCQYYFDVAELEREFSKRITTIASKNTKREVVSTELNVPAAATGVVDDDNKSIDTKSEFDFEDSDTTVAMFYKDMNSINAEIANGLRNTADMITSDIFQGIYLVR